jgi:hypothetical protein
MKGKGRYAKNVVHVLYKLMSKYFLLEAYGLDLAYTGVFMM